MTVRGKLSIVNLSITLALALVLLGAGVLGIVRGLIHGQLPLVLLALFAISCAVL